VTKQPTPEALQSFFGGLVSVIEPSESVPQVAFRGYFEAKPTLAGDATRVFVSMRASAWAFASKAAGMGLNLRISEDDEWKPRVRGRAAKILPAR